MSAAVDLRFGDCLAVLRELPDESVHAIVTDPPYGLEFMGAGWDGQVPGVAYWRECLRVAKPGAHLLAFGGTRTFHRLAVAIEDAGWEIRDSITWLYGSGFPKSLDVSKAIDKAHRRDYVLAAVELGLSIPGNNLHDWTKAEHAPGDAWWGKFKAHLSPEQWGAIERQVVGYTQGRSSALHEGGQSTGQPDPVTAPATPAAEQWQGWGTALKPAQEPIIVARKPLAGTVAANVLAHGTGGINVDACRVNPGAVIPGGGGGDRSWKVNAPDGSGHAWMGSAAVPGTARESHTAGRRPANVVLVHDPSCRPPGECEDGCPVAELDRQSGTLKSGYMRPEVDRSTRQGDAYGTFSARTRTETYADSGGASRFFPTFRYQAKAPARERPKIDGKGWPTVKPLGLMRWLVRLVTPPGGLVLDPFAGTGSTLQAARDEGFASIGIELDAFAFALAQQRLALPAEAAPVDETPSLFDLVDGEAAS